GADLQEVPQDEPHGDAGVDWVGPRGRPQDPKVRLPRDRPAAGRRQALQVLLHALASSNFRRRHGSVSSIRMIIRFDAWRGRSTFFSSSFSIFILLIYTVPCDRCMDVTLS